MIQSKISKSNPSAINMFKVKPKLDLQAIADELKNFEIPYMVRRSNKVKITDNCVTLIAPLRADNYLEVHEDASFHTMAPKSYQKIKKGLNQWASQYQWKKNAYIMFDYNFNDSRTEIPEDSIQIDICNK